jgi:hypothetical protein
MRFRLGRNTARAAVLIAVAGAGLVGVQSAASAFPTGCSAGTGYSIQYFGWALCTGGTGYYQVSVDCSGTISFGPVRRVGQGRSSRACPGGARPRGVVNISWE